MNIDVVYQPTEARQRVSLHYWDENGLERDAVGTRSADGRSFQFTITSSTQDQREVSFKYKFEGFDWERDDFIRTVPTLSATKLWTFDYSARCLTAEPGTQAQFPNVTIHAISRHRFLDGKLYVWVPSSNPGPDPEPMPNTSSSVEDSETIFEVQLDDHLRNGFHFKLVGKGSQNDFKDYEPDFSIRVWRPSDGPEVWIKSGQVDLRPEAIALEKVPIDLVYPPTLGIYQPSLGAAHLHIKDLVDDFDDTIDHDPATGLTIIDQHFVRARYNVSVYRAATYKIVWDTEPLETARRFRIPLDGSGGPSMAVNGYDHWLLQLPPAVDGRLNLVVHPNLASNFGQTIAIVSGIGAANAHQSEIATKQPDGTWTASFNTLPGVPCWLALAGESRVDGPLDFSRQFQTTAAAAITLHTVDGVGGVARNAPQPFRDVPVVTRQALMKSVYGSEVLAAPVFEPWEMPHGTSTLDGQVYFTVRAPHAMAMSLHFLKMPESTPPQVREIPMELTTDLRYWYCAVSRAEAPPGTCYRFAYQDGRELLTPQLGQALDPASRWVLDRGNLIVDAVKDSTEQQSWSRVCDPDTLKESFVNSSWKTPDWGSLLIYEMHVRRFTQRNPRNSSTCDFDQVTAEMNGGYLERLPVTALEFLPLHEFPGDAGWGYNPSLFFAIDSDYGGPQPFARLVRACHDKKRAVLLDIVFNHMVLSPLQALARDVYISGQTAWGDMVHYAHPAAIEFFRQALVYLWSTFHVDGFRFDSTETIINGHRDNTPSAPYILARGPDGKLRTGAGKGWEFLGILRKAIRDSATAIEKPWPYFVGENDPENTGMTDPQSGVQDGQWHFPEMYALGAAAYNKDDKAGDVRYSLQLLDQPLWRAVTFGGSHDSESGRPGQDRIVRRAGGFGRQMAKAVGAIALLSRGIPMLLMGDEAGEDIPFPLNMVENGPGFVLRLDEYEKPGGEFLRVLTWFRDLMGLRGNGGNGLWNDGGQSLGSGRKTVAFSRAEGRFFVIATFGTPDTQQDLGWLNLPGGAVYKEIFNSTSDQYRMNAEQAVNNGGTFAQLRAGNLIHLPNIGAIVLERL
jgi:1,4-alpha-glucan branching enzyme